MKSAFTMIELIFVIVILGVLAAVSIPKLAATRGDAEASSKASEIMTGATEIAAYAVAKGNTLSDFAVMSNSFKHLKESGSANLDENDKAVVKAGNIEECITITITRNSTDDILSISFGSANGDSVCTSIQSLINIHDYPMKLRGQSVIY